MNSFVFLSDNLSDHLWLNNHYCLTTKDSSRAIRDHKGYTKVMNY